MLPIGAGLALRRVFQAATASSPTRARPTSPDCPLGECLDELPLGDAGAAVVVTYLSAELIRRDPLSPIGAVVRTPTTRITMPTTDRHASPLNRDRSLGTLSRPLTPTTAYSQFIERQFLCVALTGSHARAHAALGGVSTCRPCPEQLLTWGRLGQQALSATLLAGPAAPELREIHGVDTRLNAIAIQQHHGRLPAVGHRRPGGRRRDHQLSRECCAAGEVVVQVRRR